ncbi:MAG: hypothetical protein E7360_00505 [Clostridiales bacterium]|nr:hypothetical protein [Clostridiales bacterium]
MKKLLLALVLVLCSCFSLAACSFGSGANEDETYTITFRQNGYEDVVKTVKSGEDLLENDIPNTQEKVGYTVTWEDVDLTNVKSNLVVNAVENPNTYTITYDANEGTVTPETQEVTYDSDVTLATPERAEYDFTGWYYEEKAVNNGKWTIADNVTLVAGWVKQVVNTYTVTFIQNGQEKVEYTGIVENTSFTNIPDPIAKVGYAVTWKEEDLAKLENITANVVVNAVETPNTYTITYDANEGVVTPENQEVIYDSDITLATPERDGYTFTGWTYEGNAVTNGTWTIAENVTLVATWQEILEKFTVTFVQAGCESKTYTDIVENTSFTNIPDPIAKVGYNVTWKAEDLAKLTSVTENVVVNAVETPNTYTITYDVNGGESVQPQDVTYDSDVTLATPERDGYTFMGWTYEGNAVINGKWTIAKNVTLVATWTKNVVKTYTVTFKQDGKADIVIEGVEEGAAILESQIPALEPVKGYKVEWNADDLAKLSNVTENVTVNVTKTAKKFTVKFTVDNQGKPIQEITVTYGETYTLPNAESDEAQFSAWTYNGVTVAISGTWDIDSDSEVIELVSKWGSSNWTGNY